MKNLALALHAGEPVKRNAITRHFNNCRWIYWHWIDDFWIVQVPNSYTPKSLHQELESLTAVGTTTILVFEFQGRIRYWGRAKKAAWKWLSHIGTAG